tara:strand:+ start:407 stop:562 length:156 start_codon:yes stop_codon:yes gene_type:complete
MSNTLIFLPVRTEDDVMRDLVKVKNKQSVLRIKENKLIDELVSVNKEDKDG